MDDELTLQVLDCKRGDGERAALEQRILLLVWEHLKNYRRHDEDDVSGFLVQFLPQIGRLIDRFRDRGVPFHHYVLRTVRWRWTTWQARQAAATHQDVLLAEPGNWTDQVAHAAEEVAEPRCASGWQLRSPAQAQRVILLTLKAAPCLEDEQVESICRLTGVDRAWLDVQLKEARRRSQKRVDRAQTLAVRQSETYWKRLVAEDRCRREPDPEQRKVWEHRAEFFRQRLTRLRLHRERLSVAPTHRDLSEQLGIPKGTVDSALYHLKRELGSLYSGEYDPSAGHQQPSQKRRTRTAVSRPPAPASP